MKSKKEEIQILKSRIADLEMQVFGKQCIIDDYLESEKNDRRVMTDDGMFQSNQRKKKKETIETIFPGNKRMQEALQELVGMSEGNNKLAWEDILNPPNAGVSAYHVQSIARVLIDPHSAAGPKTWDMNSESIMIFCGRLLQNLWFNGGMFELNMVRHLIPRWDSQISKLGNGAKEEQKNEYK